MEVSDWKEAIRACGRLLEADSAVEARYTPAMIRVAREFGPYIVVAPGIALPHAFPSDGVIKPSMALVKLKTPVYFGNKDNDPVWLLVALAALDSHQHLRGLADLADILSNELNIRKLHSCRTPKELLDVFYQSIPAGTVDNP